MKGILWINICPEGYLDYWFDDLMLRYPSGYLWRRLVNDSGMQMQLNTRFIIPIMMERLAIFDNPFIVMETYSGFLNWFLNNDQGVVGKHGDHQTDFLSINDDKYIYMHLMTSYINHKSHPFSRTSGFYTICILFKIIYSTSPALLLRLSGWVEWRSRYLRSLSSRFVEWGDPVCTYD